MSQSIVVHFLPVAMEEGTDEEEKSALRLMEIGDKHLHYLVLIAGAMMICVLVCKASKPLRSR